MKQEPTGHKPMGTLDRREHVFYKHLSKLSLQALSARFQSVPRRRGFFWGLTVAWDLEKKSRTVLQQLPC